MKIKRTSASLLTLKILLFIFAFSSETCNAQGNKSVFVEFFGNGIGASANYDARFNKKENGLGFRAGLGYYPATVFNKGFVTIPLGLNYLVGKAPHHLEAGGGITILPNVTVFGDGGYQANGIVIIPSIGYRYAHKNKGFQGRAILSPFFGGAGVQMFFGISSGYKF